MGDLGIIALESAYEMGKRVSGIIAGWRGEDRRLIAVECPRFGTGEGKGLIKESIRNKDLYILVDVCNSSIRYKMDGEYNRMSPDDHYQDLKRIIGACNGKASRITVIMPFLYESRQHRRNGRESLDCAMMLRELEEMGVHHVITFDAHDQRVQNSIPFRSLESVSCALQFTQKLLSEVPDISIDDESLMFIAPDEGATHRAVFLASLFGVNMGMFYKRRDYTKVVNGTNPIVAHEFCGESVRDKDVIIVDDIISSGGSAIDTARQLKGMGAKRIFMFATFGMFTHGLEGFDQAFRNGEISRIFTTDLIYQKPELMDRGYHSSVAMGRYIAAMIDTLNKGGSLQELITPAHKIKDTVETYKASHTKDALIEEKAYTPSAESMHDADEGEASGEKSPFYEGMVVEWKQGD